MADTRSQRPSTAEEEFFARESAEKARRLAEEERARTGAAERERQKALHWMRCPKCGAELRPVKHRHVEVDACFSCHGVFLDEGEIEQLSESGRGSLLGEVIGWFKG